MTLRVYDELIQGTDEWLAARRGMVTASVVGKLLTPTLRVADNDTSRALVGAIVAERITGTSEEVHVTPDMWRGTQHEPYARAAYVEHHGPVTEVGFMVRELNGLRLGYSPDGLVGDRGLIEIKCPRAKTHMATIISDTVPAQYMAQCQAGLWVSARFWCDFVSFHAGMPLYVKRVHADPHWFEAIDAALAAFEDDATRLTDAYNAAAAGLPPTEPIPDLELVL